MRPKIPRLVTCSRHNKLLTPSWIQSSCNIGIRSFWQLYGLRKKQTYASLKLHNKGWISTPSISSRLIELTKAVSLLAILASMPPCERKWCSSRAILSWITSILPFNLASSPRWRTGSSNRLNRAWRLVCSFFKAFKLSWKAPKSRCWQSKVCWMRSTLFETSQNATERRRIFCLRREFSAIKSKSCRATLFSKSFNLCSCWSVMELWGVFRVLLFPEAISFGVGAISSLNSKLFSRR